MNAVIIEDEALARKELRLLLEEHPQIQILGEAPSLREAIRLIESLRPDLIFLDVNLRGGTGLDLLAALGEKHPPVIFTTAHADFARQAFDFDAIDYLVKPIRPERLARALLKLSPLSSTASSQEKEIRLFADSKIFLRDQEKSWYVALKDIALIESEGNYSRFHVPGDTALIHSSLSAVEERLPADLFFRANRAQLVNLSHIQTVEPWFSQTLKTTLRGGTIIEFSRRSSLIFRETRSI